MSTSIKSLLAPLAVSFSLVLPLGAAQAQDDALKNIQAKKVLTMGIATDFPPYGFVGPDFKPQGLEIDLANLIAEKLGVKPELVPVTNPNRIPYLQTRKIDLIVSTLGKNEERQKVIDFTAAYAPFFQAVYGPKAETIKTIEDLAGRSTSVTRGTIQDDILTQVAPKSLKIQRFEDDSSTVAAFVSGQTELLVTGASVADAVIKKNPKLNAEFKVLLKDSPNFIGVRKGEDSLRLAVNEVLLAAKADGTLEALSQKWLGRGTGDLPE